MVRWIILINKAECKFLFRYFVVTTSHNVRHLKNVTDVRFHYISHNVSRYFSPSQGQRLIESQRNQESCESQES